MPPEVRDPSDPAEWLRRAQGDMALAKVGSGAPGVLYEDLCFHARQAAEKAIKAVKAVLVMRQADFPKTHVIERLLDLLRRADVEVPAEVRQSARLSDYATRSRYTGAAEDVSEGQYERALELAEHVLRWAEGLIGRPTMDRLAQE